MRITTLQEPFQDLSTKHLPVGGIFKQPLTQDEWDRYRLTEEQIEFYQQNGYVAGIRLLADDQVDQLRDELSALVAPSHPGRHLFYEYNSNESARPSRILFHALGAWRVAPGFHDLLWNPAFLIWAVTGVRPSGRFDTR